MQVTEIKIEELKIKQSAKITAAEEINLYKNLYEKYKVRVPIVIDSEKNIFMGEAKYYAARELNLETMPCVMLDEMSEEELKLSQLVEYRAQQLLEFDEDILFEELKKLGEEAFITGFDMEELEAALADKAAAEETEEIEIPEVEEENFSQQGDIYLLGKHRLMCGDSTSEKDVVTLMNGEEADLMVTDPPYNVNYEGTNGLKIKNDHMKNSEFYQFLKKFYENAFKVMKEGAGFYVFHADSETYSFRRALEEAGFKLSQCLIWIKNGFNLSRQDYNWKHEPCLYGWKEGKKHYFIKDYTQDTILEAEENLKKLSKNELLKYIEGMRENYLQYSTAILENKPLKNDVHPTMKPIKLLSRLIINSSRKNSNVIDLFGGSGSTLIACEQLERKAFLMEFDEKYADVIVKRYMKMGKDDIQLIRNGVTYNWEEIKDNFTGE